MTNNPSQMNKFILAALALLTFSNNSLRAAQTAAARMYCLSVRFNEAHAGGPNAIYSLDLTGINNSLNGELYPVFGQARSHFSSLVLTDEIFEDEIFGSVFLDVPGSDSDGDGFPDFFNTAQAFSGTSSGSYNFPGFASGNVTANWSRGVNENVGTCQLNFQNFGSFSHIFNVLEYRGTLAYTPGTNVVAANLDLELTGVPDSDLQGPIAFTKSPTNSHNQLDFGAGILTNAIPETYSFLDGTLSRDATWPTNYFSFFEFDDWLLSTGEADYYLWVISIDDLNDADSDDVPDFSDDPQVVSSRRPLLSLNHGSGNLSLTISGNVGQICEIQEASTIDAASWPPILSVTLTNDPQIVSLPLPSAGTRFWRVRTQ